MPISRRIERVLVFVISAESCWPGVARQQVTFFCFAKRKSPKKRRPAVWVPTLRFGQPAVLGPAGVKNNSPAVQTSFCPDPSGPPLLGASTRVGAGRRNTKQPDTNTKYLKKQGLALASPCLSWFVLCISVFCPRSRLPRPGWAEERRDKRIRAGVV